jgi:hypothetical protein
VTATLQRSVAARLRPLGVLEVCSWIGILVLPWTLVVGPAFEIAAKTVALILSLGVRWTVWHEEVVADDDGVVWQSLFWRRRIEWSAMGEVGWGSMSLFPSTHLGAWTMQLRCDRGEVRNVRPSALCDRSAVEAFMETLPVATDTHRSRRWES